MPPGLPRPEAQPVSSAPFASVSEWRIHVPVPRPSAVLEQAAGSAKISLTLNSDHLLEVVFNQEREGKLRDLRPELPLVIRW
jgi:hypothetical protein